LGSIAIDDGQIQAVGPDVASEYGDATDVIDAAGKIAIPGVVDIHNHLHDPNLFQTVSTSRLRRRVLRPAA